MAKFILVLCRKWDRVLSAREIVDFVEEGCYFEDEPEFEIKPYEAAEIKEWDWERVLIRYDKSLRPVIVANTGPGQLMTEELDELREELKDVEGDVVDRVLQHLEQVCRVLSLELSSENVSDDAWEMIDSLEGYAAKRCEGLIYASDEGYFDADLQLILKV